MVSHDPVQLSRHGIGAGGRRARLHVPGSRRTVLAEADGAANVYAPGKRPFHTIIPAFVMKDGKPFMAFGVMGGDMQPQGHVQVLTDMIDFGMNVQEAGDAARWRHYGNAEPTGEPSAGIGTVEMETRLRSRGESRTGEARLQGRARHRRLRRLSGDPVRCRTSTSIGARPKCARTAKRSATDPSRPSPAKSAASLVPSANSSVTATAAPGFSSGFGCMHIR